jgi:putative hemolysin
MDSTILNSDGIAPIAAGNLVARLAETEADIDAAQALRYRVFFEEMDAIPSAENIRTRRDVDAFDRVCDHLLVIARDRPDLPGGGVVGTYRLLRRSVAMRHGVFYSAAEYDIAPIVAHPGEIMELGRSCVHADYRTRPTMQLLWRAIAAYVFHHDITLMFGCACLPGAEPSRLALPLSYLYYNHLAPDSFRPRALNGRYIDMRLLDRASIDAKEALAALPPLIKGYLRLGGFVGDGAVVDPQFNTTDVCVMVKTDLITDKYYRHYERTARQVAAG